MASEGFVSKEGWWTTEDGAKLYTQSWFPSGPVKARIVFVHGFSDHCNTQGSMFPEFARRGIETHAWDQRGWGQSVLKPSQKGQSGPTSQVLADIDAFIQRHLPSPVPLFLMGHSMGGQEILQFAARGPASTRSQIRGYIAEAPFVAVSPATAPSRFTVMAGRLAAKLLPNHQMVNKLQASLLCRDPAVCQKLADDPRCHDTGTLEGLKGMLERGEELEKGTVVMHEDSGRPKGETGLWMGHGSGDEIVDFSASKQAFDRIDVQDKTFKEYPGWFHVLHEEPDGDKDIFINDVAQWTLARS